MRALGPLVALLRFPARTSSPPLENGLPLLRERPERLVAVLGGHDAVIHGVLDALVRPLHGLQGGAHGDRPALAHLHGQPDGLAQHAAPRGGEQAGGGGLVPGAQGLGLPLALLGRHRRIVVPPVAAGDDLDEAVRDAEEVGLGGGDAASREHEVAGAGDADEGGEAVGAAGARDDAEAGLGEGDEGVGGEDAEVRGQGELEAAAEGEGADGGDGRDGERGEGGQGAAEGG